MAFPVSRPYSRYTLLKWGTVIFSTFSLTLILGSTVPSGSSTATSLYTPPNTGSDLAVIIRSPTPNRSICAPWSSISRMRYSSSELDTEILHSVQPASSSISRAFRVR